MADLKAELDARARSYICSYCNIASVPVSLEYIIPLMVAEDLNATGSEGLSSKGAAGVSEAYLNDYSEKVLKILRRYRRIRTV